MRVKVSNMDVERQLLIGMITSDAFLKQITPIFKYDYLSSDSCRTICKWILEYYNRYSKAPGKNIQSIFEDKKILLSEEELDWFENILSSLSGEYEASGLNESYTFDRVTKYFKGQNLRNRSKQILELLEEDRVEEAEQIWVEDMKVVTGVEDMGFDPFDEETALRIFRQEEEMRVKFTTGIEALDRMTGPSKSEWLVLVMGPMKRGKCLSEDSMILLFDGRLKRLKSVVEKKCCWVKTLDENGKIVSARVSDFFDNEKKPVYEVVTRTGRKVTVTKDHPFLTIDGWCSLDSLSVGNYIGVPSKYNISGARVMQPHKIKILAYLLAEGGLTGSRIGFTSTNKYIKNDFIKSIKLMGDDINWKDNEITGSIRKGKNSTGLSNNTKKWLRSIDLKFCLSKEKELPNVIFRLSMNCLSLFLSVLFTCDGCICMSKSQVIISYSSASRILIDQVVHLLLRFGIICRVRDKNINGFLSWEIIIQDKKNSLLFLEKIGFLFDKRKKSMSFLKYIKDKKDGRGFIDVFPPEFSKIVKKRLSIFTKKNRGKLDRLWWRQRPLRSLEQSLRTGCCMNRNTVNRIADVIDDDFLRGYVNSDILWDKIKSIKYVGKKQTYDLTIDKTHNFIANDMIVHNTAFLFHCALRGVIKGLNVAVFTFESSEGDSSLRLWSSFGSITTDGSSSLKFPVFTDRKACEVGYRDVQRPTYSLISVMSAIKRFKKVASRRKGKMKVKIFPSYSGSIDDMDRCLDAWEVYEGFNPHLILVDYLGIILAPKGLKGRDIVDYNGKKLKGMSEVRKALVMSAIQGKRETLEQIITMRGKDVPEDIRLLGHVDAMYGLNQTEIEKEEGKMRINVIAHRHRKFNPRVQAMVLQQLEAGQFHLDSVITKVKDTQKRKKENN